jgi:enoyl-CoA hydratase/carnithine racemase
MTIIEETRYGVKVITIDRQDKLNSLNTEALNSLSEKVTSACNNHDVKAVMITGKGKLFSSGIDLEEIAKSSTPKEARKPFEALGTLLKALINCPKPVATYLNGPAIAGGAEIALASDVILSSSSTYISWPEIKWGLIAPMLAARLQVTPHYKLLHAALTSGRISSQEAIEMGLIASQQETLEDAIKYLTQTLETSSQNPEATKLYLEYRRKHLKENIDKISQLAKLAESPELIEKARKFLSKH